MSDMPTKCLHGRNFCLECHGDHRPDDPAPKPRCPVFGCIIPHSAEHTHPTNDPSLAQLDNPVSYVHRTYIIPSVAPMVPGRKLRDALLMAGHNVEHFDQAKKATEEAISRKEPSRSFVKLIGSIAWRLAVALVIAGLTVLVLAGSRP